MADKSAQQIGARYAVDLLSWRAHHFFWWTPITINAAGIRTAGKRGGHYLSAYRYNNTVTHYRVSLLGNQ